MSHLPKAFTDFNRRRYALANHMRDAHWNTTLINFLTEQSACDSGFLLACENGNLFDTLESCHCGKGWRDFAYTALGRWLHNVAKRRRPYAVRSRIQQARGLLVQWHSHLKTQQGNNLQPHQLPESLRVLLRNINLRRGPLSMEGVL